MRRVFAKPRLDREKQNTGAVARSGAVSGEPAVRSRLHIRCGVVVGLLNSECSQQHSADKNKSGAHCQQIQSQGKVHGRASLVEMLES
jgi:hypothetical protein